MLTVVVGDWDSGLNLLSFLTSRSRILLVIVPVIFTVVFLTLQKFVKYSRRSGIGPSVTGKSSYQTFTTLSTKWSGDKADHSVNGLLVQ